MHFWVIDIRGQLMSTSNNQGMRSNELGTPGILDQDWMGDTRRESFTAAREQF